VIDLDGAWEFQLDPEGTFTPVELGPITQSHGESVSIARRTGNGSKDLFADGGCVGKEPGEPMLFSDRDRAHARFGA